MPWAYRVMVEERRWITQRPISPRRSACASSCPGRTSATPRSCSASAGSAGAARSSASSAWWPCPSPGCSRSPPSTATTPTIPLVRSIVIGVGAAGAGLFIGTAVKLGRPLASKPGAWVVAIGLLPRGGGRPRVAAHRDPGRSGRRALPLEGEQAVTLVDLALYFGLLSLISVGGMPSVIPEMQRYVVDVRQWVTPTDFIQMFAIGQAAPGPNVLISGADRLEDRRRRRARSSRSARCAFRRRWWRSGWPACGSA